MQKIKVFNNIKKIPVVNKSIRFFFRKNFYVKYFKYVVKHNVIGVSDYNFNNRFNLNNNFSVYKNQRYSMSSLVKLKVNLANNNLYKFFSMKNKTFKGKGGNSFYSYYA